MTATLFAKPSGAPKTRKRSAGGDNEVPRDSKDRPIIYTPCANCDATGRVPSTKRPGNTVQCPKCKGQRFEGNDFTATKRSYTRVTTYIDCLEDKKNIEEWKLRKVLIGVATDGKLLNGVLDHDDTEQDGRNWLNRRAERAADIGGASERSEKGSELHEWSEYVDEGSEIPWELMTFEDTVDMQAYVPATKDLSIVHMEKLVVNDELHTGGTPDRVSRWIGDTPLITPDGQEITYDELIITDLKTGRIDYGQLKMAMQLAIYSRSELYDWKTFARTSMGNVNTSWGIIIHLAAGSGVCNLYWANLNLGWAAVGVAGEVRAMRRMGKKALVPLAS